MKKLLRKKLALMLANLKKKRPYYCEVEYLESTGTQYIDTGWSPVSNDLRVNFRTKSMSSPATTAVCGAEKSGVNPRWVFILYGQNTDTTKTFPLTGDWNNNSNGFTFTSGSVLEIDWTTSSTSTTITDNVSGTTYTKTFGSAINYSNNNITLKLFQNGNNQKSSIQINYYKIWDNGVLVRDLIPVLDWSYIPCMYDKVSGQLFYNAGTGDFIYGREIHYVDYLESTGTQYIDTGVTLTNNHSVEIDYQLTSASQNRKGIFGGLVTNGARYGALLSPSNNYLEFGYGSTNVWYQKGLPDTNRHVMKQEKNLLYFDGSLEYTFSTATFTQNFTSPLGNFNYTNYNPASAKYYSSKWWDGDTIIRNYKPAIDENGVGFMFDKVSHTCFLNQGTGAFKVNGKIVENEYE